MKTAIVMTTFNGQDYVYEQIESIRHQTKGVDDVYIYDDCSIDNTVEIIRNFIKQNDLRNWHFIVNENNMGWRRNFMQGLWNCDADIVFTADQDDIWEKNKVEIMLDIMEKNPHIDLLVSRYNNFYEDGKKCINKYKVKRGLKRVKRSRCFFSVHFPGNTYCIRSTLIDSSRSVWFEESPHDALLWRMALVKETLYCCSDVLVNVRRHDSTFAREAKNNKKFESRKKWLNYAAKTLESINIYYNSFENDKKFNSVIKNNIKWINRRVALFEKRRIRCVFPLLANLRFYENNRQFLADVYLSIISRQRG